MLSLSPWKSMLSVIGCIGVLAAADAAAFEPAVLDSVVRLKPNWSQAMRGNAPQDPQGSGVAVLPGGYIATNVHVIGDAEDIDVLLQDGRVLAATVIGTHPPTDLALLKVDVDLPVLATADPPPLAGRVCAVGNQFGLGLSVTCGVVSAVGRSGTGFNPIEDFVQTDASINPGGSGGALVDDRGRLVGLVSAIFTKESDANIGVNFAASARLLMRVIEDLQDDGAVQRRAVGFRAGAVPPPMNAETGGVMVTRVDIDGPAFAAGLEAGDIVTQVGDLRVPDPGQFETALFLSDPKMPLTLMVQRGESRREVTLAATR